MSLVENFKGKRVLVTGASRGIGKAIVERLHAYDAIVFAVSRNPQNLVALKQQFPKITPIAVNLNNWNEAKEALESIRHVDFLVNNAGVLQYEEFFDIQPEAFDKQFNTNLRAVINVSQVIGRKMVQAGTGGSIVNISSTAGQSQTVGLAVYSSTKAALDSLTRSMAVELGKHKIRVNAIAPGEYETDMLVKDLYQGMGLTKEQVAEHWDSKMPLGRTILDMESLINSILFVLSDLSSMTTGQCLAVDGGFLCL